MDSIDEKRIIDRIRVKTDSRYGVRPVARPIQEYISKGVINLDKPAGPTSHEVVAWVRDMLHLNKAAHSGTLDPKVSGVQPILLGDAVALSDALKNVDKEYVCLMEMHDDIAPQRLEELFFEFTGPIYQIPPMKSAVRRVLRVRNVHYLNLIEMEERSVLFRVGCEAGTYIRKLCYDIGEVFCMGAHMRELRRTRSGHFSERELYTLHELADAWAIYEESGDEEAIRKIIKPMESALSHLPSVYVVDSAVDSLCHGAPLAMPGISSFEASIHEGDLVAVFTLKSEVIMLGKALISGEEMITSKSGLAVSPYKVVMKPGIYPKMS
ncbi:MAG: RNA-guided pseudouridylation complex pseudouridine synthase subunit Cbf5 [Methermicoccaceae archaeon]